MKIKSKAMLVAGISLSMLSAGMLPLIVTSCSDNPAQVVNQSITGQLLSMNQKYLDNEQMYLSKNSAKLPIFGYSDPSTSFDSIIINANNAISSLRKFKDNNKLSQNEIIWVDSYIFQWELKINNIKSGMIYLGGNPITGSRILSSSSNHISDFVKNLTNIYPNNPETGDPDTNATPDKELVLNLATNIIDASSSIQDYKKYLDYGQKVYGYQPATISKKLLINQLLAFFYQNELETFANNSSKNEISIAELVKLSAKNYFSDLEVVIDTIDYLSKEQRNEIKNNLKQLKNSLDDFVVWYAQDYYVDINSFGPTNTSVPIKLSKTNGSSNDAEIEKTLVAGTNDTPLYGVGLTTNNLNEKNIGIGFMKLKDGANNPFSSSNDVYQQMLNNNNSINTPANEIYNMGIKLTKDALNKMTSIAKQANEIISGGINDNTTIMYDDDGIGTNNPSSVTLGNINNTSSIHNADEKLFKQFNVWLNQEDFFWGREYLQDQNLVNFIDKYWTNPTTPELKKYKQIIINQGYEKHWFDQKTINSQATGTVTGNQALAGAVLSLKDYIDFKNSTDSTFNPNFNPIKDYVISPYNYDIRVDIGVGMEGPRGSCQFQYNCDPYYSLPKWSVSSLTTHEGKMGHHTQQEYWTEYLQGGNGQNGQGPGYTFINDAFHEGWAVFAEWFANELGIYGSELDLETRMPTNWLVANGLVPNYDANNLSILTNKMKELHAGVYYDKAKGDDGTNEKLQNAIKLANMLQYYGFLNEAQLRNMRLCLDTAYHHKPEGDEATSNDSTLPYGASIKQVRDFMTTNSALSIGDINSESIRYLVMPSQATGYMLGKIIFEDLYQQVAIKNGKNLNDFIQDKNTIKSLFDLMLRNGEIPLEVMKEQVIKQFNLSNNTLMNSYEWLLKVCEEVPNRKAGYEYNKPSDIQDHSGEKYAAEWIKSQLSNMGYAEQLEANLAREYPVLSTKSNYTDYDKQGVVYNNINQTEATNDINFNGYYEAKFLWYKKQDQKNESQNIMLNINGGAKSDGSLKDVYFVSHYDTANPKNQGTNDNSSGLALTLSIADYFAKNPSAKKSLNVDLHILFAGAEEVGVKGSWAWTQQYLASNETIRAMADSIINLDSVAGGDILYVHSPATSASGASNDPAYPQANTSSSIRDKIKELNPKLTIHPQIMDPETQTYAKYAKGETGDWSDHAPFYKIGIPIAYIESTNFNINGESGYDGYAQVTHNEFWKKKNGEQVELESIKTKDKEGNDIIVYSPKNRQELLNDDNFDAWGRLWHMDWDNIQTYNSFFPGRLQSQMVIVFQTMIDYLSSINK